MPIITTKSPPPVYTTGMLPNRTRCLILACGNPLRGDDGVGPWLAAWAEDHLRGQRGGRILCRQQWTPEMAEDLACADAVLFVDSSAASAPGTIQLVPAEPAEQNVGVATHHLSAARLLSLCRELYPSVPSKAFLLTIGMDSTELGSTFSKAVQTALPEAQTLLEKTALRLLKTDSERVER